MSKSLNNYIALTDGADEVYGRTMTIPDTMMADYYRMFTEIEDAELDAVLGHMHPMTSKKLLAKTLTSIISGNEAAEAAAGAFDTRFSKRNFEQSATGSISASMGASALFAFVSEQRGEGNAATRRLFRDGGVSLIDENGKKVAVASEVALESSIKQQGIKFLKIGKGTILSIEHS